MYGLKVNFVVVSKSGVDNIDTIYCANYPNKPDGLTTEYEFWPKDTIGLSNSWATFKTILTAMTAVHNTYPSISRNAYVSQFADYKGVTSRGYIRKYLIENCETIFLVNYSADAFNLSNSLKTRLDSLGLKAKEIHKVGNVIILFTVHQDTDPKTHDIYSYFSVQGGQNHKFKDAYNNLMAVYDSVVNTSNDGLSFKGYAIFHHTDARQARP